MTKYQFFTQEHQLQLQLKTWHPVFWRPWVTHALIGGQPLQLQKG